MWVISAFVAALAVAVPVTVLGQAAPESSTVVPSEFAASVDTSAVADATVATSAGSTITLAAAKKKKVCPKNVGGTYRSAPSARSAGGVAGTTSHDLALFAERFNAIRVANCLAPIPRANFRYDACMEQRLFWMAEDPSTNPASAWGHVGSVRSDRKPSVGCDGNLAGGANNTAATVALKWWNSPSHKSALYRPGYVKSNAHVCVFFAITHGGLPNEAKTFTRAAARRAAC